MRRSTSLPGALLLLAASLALLAGCGGANDNLLLLDEMPQVGKVTIRGAEVFEEKALKELKDQIGPIWLISENSF